ncbi:MAG: GTPase HflX [Anaerolineae bacterium]
MEQREARPVSTAQATEKAVLVGVQFQHEDENAWPVEDSLDELALLARTAGVDVVGEFTQKLDHPYPAFYIRPGKVEEIKDAKPGLEYDVVIFDDNLSPSQQRNLEKELDTRVMDRRALILDIFAQHARTREGALQVEVAQYEYLLPRLTRQWTHLSRQTRGGVGLRGPGETQLEMDRRAMHDRLVHLRRELEGVRRHRELHRRRRKKAGVPVVAIVGYTNAGKSTLLNTLSGADVLAADQLFATLDPTTRRVRLPDGGDVLFTDTVGFVQKLPADLVAAFRATLEEITEADLIVHVVDVTHPQSERQMAAVEATLEDLGAGAVPTLVVLNKIDRLDNPDDAMAEVAEDENVIAMSARTGLGREALLRRVADVLGEQGVPVRLLLPYSQSAVLAGIFRSGSVHEQEHTDDGTLVSATVPLRLLSQLEPYLLDGPDAEIEAEGSAEDEEPESEEVDAEDVEDELEYLDSDDEGDWSEDDESQ